MAILLAAFSVSAYALESCGSPFGGAVGGEGNDPALSRGFPAGGTWGTLKSPGTGVEEEESGRVRQWGRTRDTRLRDTRLPWVSLYLSESCLIHHHPLQHLLRLPGIKDSSPQDVKHRHGLPPGARPWGCQPEATWFLPG